MQILVHFVEHVQPLFVHYSMPPLKLQIKPFTKNWYIFGKISITSFKTHLERDSVLVVQIVGLLLPIVLLVAIAEFHFLTLVLLQYSAVPNLAVTLAFPPMQPIFVFIHNRIN